MRPNQASTPSLSLLYTSFQPRSSGNTNNDNHVYSTNDYYSTASAPTSPLSSTSTITSSSPTLPSSPTSPSLSPTLFQHIRNPRPISDKLRPSSLSHSHNHPHSTGIVLRRRPSNIDTALRQERSRAADDAIERQGLDLLEPRPVDLDPLGIDIQIQFQPLSQSVPVTHTRPLVQLARSDDDRARNWVSYGSPQTEVSVSQPRFVMGGIFEVMEGRG
ncbi:hypothetical protein BDW62DRAFT_183564 [Aspergillus aurantiobrunneus]